MRPIPFFHHVAAHSRGPSRAGFPVASAFGLGRWVCVHGAKNFVPRSTGNSTGYPVNSSYGGRHVTA